MEDQTQTSLFAREEDNRDQNVVESDENSPDKVNLDSPDDSQATTDERVDLGNHENDPDYDPPHINDDGHLVDSDGNKVFTTIEESLKDGSMVLDSQGRMPGVYLQDLEAEARLRHAERVENAFKDAERVSGKDVAVTREVNVTSSPLPPSSVTVNPDVDVNPAPAALDDTSRRPASEEEVTRNN